jgi:hypothetical protein
MDTIIPSQPIAKPLNLGTRVSSPELSRPSARNMSGR